MKNTNGARALTFTCLLFFYLNSIAQPCNSIPVGYTCENAPIICNLNDLDGFCTTLPDFSNPVGPNPLCTNGGVPNNCIWFGFLASGTSYNFNIIPANCTIVGGFQGIQGGIYGGDCNNLASVVCQGQCSTSIINLNSDQFIPGKVYWFILDGCNGSVCDVTIDVLAGDTSIVMGEISPIKGPTKACLGNTSVYSVEPVFGATEYHWTANDIKLGDPKKNGNKIDINFSTPGNYKVCADVSNYCVDAGEAPVKKCLDVTIEDQIPVEKFELTVCWGEKAFFKGKYYSKGFHTVIASTPDACDSTFQLTVFEKPIKETDLGTYFQKCPTDCLTITDAFGGGGTFCDETKDPVTVVLTASDGCDSLVYYNLKRFKTFKNDSLCYGDTIQIGNQNVYEPGAYTLDTLKIGDTCYQEIINLKWANEFYYTASLCNGDTINIGGNLYAKGGNYIVPLNNASGCDSVMQLKIVIVPTSKNQLFLSIKSGDVYFGMPILKDTSIVKIFENQYGCDSVVTYNFKIKTSINESKILSQKLMAIPNPASEQISFETENELVIAGYEIYSSLGLVIINSNKTEKLPLAIKIDQLPAGMYWVNFKTKGGSLNGSFIKK